MATNWARIERVVEHARRSLLYGPPGTGKSTLAQAGREDDDIIRVSLHDEMTVAEFVGHFILVGNRTVWLDGPVLHAWRYGKRLVLDEIDLAAGAVLSICRAVLDDKRVARLTIPDKDLATLDDDALAYAITHGKGLETLRPTEGFQVIATMNGEPEDLDGPLAERFEAKFLVDEPHPNAIAALPAPLRTTAKRTAVESDETRRISVRTWHNFVDLAAKVGHDDALHAVFGARAGDIADGLRLGGVKLDELFGGSSTSKKVKGEKLPASGARRSTLPPLDDEDAAAREKRLGALTRSDLRAMAAERGMQQGPNKAALVRRLALAGVDA